MIFSIERNPVKKISEKLDFFYLRKGDFDFEFPIKMSFIASFQNYRTGLIKSSFDRKFYTEKTLIPIIFDKADI